MWLVVRETGIFSVDQVRRRNAVNIREQLDLVNWVGSDWAKYWNRLLAGEPIAPRQIKQLASANPKADMPSCTACV